MTLKRFRELVALAPFRGDRFGVHRILAFIDIELIRERGPDFPAPEMLWDDNGMLVCSEEDDVAIYFGCRIDGWWIVDPPRVPEPVSEEGDINA